MGAPLFNMKGASEPTLHLRSSVHNPLAQMKGLLVDTPSIADVDTPAVSDVDTPSVQDVDTSSVQDADVDTPSVSEATRPRIPKRKQQADNCGVSLKPEQAT